MDQLHSDHRVLVLSVLVGERGRTFGVVYKAGLDEGHLDSGVFHVLAAQLFEVQIVGVLLGCGTAHARPIQLRGAQVVRG